MMTALCYLNHNRWVADCPVTGCGDALALYPEIGGDAQGNPILSDVPRYVQTCKKGHPFRLDAPPDEMRAQIEQAVADRPEPNRNWLPDGHPWGAMYGYTTGLSIAEVHEETAHHMALAEAERALNLAAVMEQLAGFGLHVGADGTVHGKLPTE